MGCVFYISNPCQPENTSCLIAFQPYAGDCKGFKNTRTFFPPFQLQLLVLVFSEYILPSKNKYRTLDSCIQGSKAGKDFSFLFPHMTKIILSKLEANYKLLGYFIWRKYFQQNTEITEIIMYLGKKKRRKLLHSCLIFPKTNQLQLIQGTVFHTGKV